MAAEARLSCPNGCFEVTYQASIDDEDTEDRDFVNKLGVPTWVSRRDGTCPHCDSDVSVVWPDQKDQDDDQDQTATAVPGGDD